jgi:hypothetical protein
LEKSGEVYTTLFKKSTQFKFLSSLSFFRLILRLHGFHVGVPEALRFEQDCSRFTPENFSINPASTVFQYQKSGPRILPSSFQHNDENPAIAKDEDDPL